MGARGAAVGGAVRPGAARTAEPGVREEAFDLAAEHLEARPAFELPVDHAEPQGGLLLGGEAAPCGQLTLEAPPLARASLPHPGGQRLRAALAVPRQPFEQPLLVERLPAAADGNEVPATRHAEEGVFPSVQPDAAVLCRLAPGSGLHAGSVLVVVPVALVGLLRVSGSVAVLVARVLTGVPRGGLLVLGTGAFLRGEVADHLADSHVAQLLGPEEILLRRPQVVVRVGVLRVLRDVLGRSRPLSLGVVRELRPDVLDRLRAPHDAVPHEPVAGHGRPARPGLQVPLRRVLLRVARLGLQERVFFGLRDVLRGVLPCRVGAHLGVEEHHVHRRGGERREAEVVRDHVLVVGRVPPAVRHPLALLVELLLGLFRPREEEPAVGAVFHAIADRAGVQVEPGLDGP